MTADHAQFIRKASLVVLRQSSNQGDNYDSRVQTVLPQALDLSQLRFQFKTENVDEEGPTNCVVRVFNLSQSTVEQILRYNYTQLVLQAGYEGQYGVIFKGDIKQFRVGRIDAKDSFLDILAADGDLAYNFSVIGKTLSAQENTPQGKHRAIVEAFSDFGVSAGPTPFPQTGGVVEGLRGKTMWGMTRAYARDLAETFESTWSIQNGKLTMIPLTAYLPGEAVRLTAATGLIGVPRQTQSGVEFDCLLNPLLQVGGRVQIDNKSIAQTLGQSNLPGFQIPFNQWAGVQNFASVTRDGFYRAYIVEHEGDTRGQSWYSHCTALAIDSSSGNVKPYG